jgi:leucyl aminopeptidase
MEITLLTDAYESVVTDVLVVPVFEGEDVETGILQVLNAQSQGIIASLYERQELHGKANETAYLPTNLAARRVLLVGVGKAEKYTANQLRQLAGTAVRTLAKKGVTQAAILLRGDVPPQIATQALTEGAILATFEIGSYKTVDKEESKLASISIIVTPEQLTTAKEGLRVGRIVGESANLTRELVNTPSGDMTPSDMAACAEKIADATGMKIDILDEERMEALGMGALLGVARGSNEEARLIVLEYAHPDALESDAVALVGKGITFDSGGISIKPSEGMEKMKYDMAGAATVMGTMRALGYLKPKARVWGIMACAENMPSGTAIKPGDVLRSMAGKTIEVINTDAEGRLVLADAVFYAREILGAKKIVDLATLTGAVGIALGPVYAALLGTCQQMIEELIVVGRQTGENYWQLPLDEEYGEQIRSDIADVKNSAGRPAGTITGAYFIREFAGDTPWVHIDIASTAWYNENKPYISKGPSAIGVRTLTQWVLNMAN